MSDSYLGHIHEVVNIPKKEEILERVIERELPTDFVRKFSYKDDITGDYIIPKPPIMGTDYCPGLFLHQPHNYEGLPSPKLTQFMEVLIEKINRNKDKICITEQYKLEDADIVIVGYGLPVRASYRAVDIARKEGIKVGILRLVTVWPFPDEVVKEAVKNVKTVIVPEMNYTGFIAEQVERVSKLGLPIIKIPKVGEIHHPDDILKVIKEVAK